MLIIGIVLGECVENKLVLSLYIVRSRGSIMRVKYDGIMCCVNVCVYINIEGFCAKLTRSKLSSTTNLPYLLLCIYSIQYRIYAMYPPYSFNICSANRVSATA